MSRRRGEWLRIGLAVLRNTSLLQNQEKLFLNVSACTTLQGLNYKLFKFFFWGGGFEF